MSYDNVLVHQLMIEKELDMSLCKPQPGAMEATFQLTDGCHAYGLVGWFDTHLTKNISFSTGPFAPYTHWNQLIFSLPKPVEIKPQKPVTISFHPVPDIKKTGTVWKWSLKTNETQIEMDDFVHKAWIGKNVPEGWLT